MMTHTDLIAPLPLDAGRVGPVPPASLGLLGQIAAALAGRASDTLSARDAYLAQAIDHDDLRRRVGDWDAHEARTRQLPVAL